MRWLGLYFPNLECCGATTKMHDLMANMAYGHSNHLGWLFSDTLVLEIERSRYLYDTPKALIEQLLKQISALNQPVQYGLAPNPMAASLMAKQAYSCWDQQSLIRQLNRCPIEALALTAESKKAMFRCGIHTLGALWQQPADQRTRRFGQTVEHYIQKLYGQRPTLIQAFHPEDHYYQRIDLIEPICNKKRLKVHLEHALHELKTWLIKRNRAVTQLSVRCKQEPQARQHFPDAIIDIAPAEPGFDDRHLKALLNLKLDALTLQCPISTLIIECQSTNQYQPPHRDLFDQYNTQGDWSELLDRLSARLGPDALSSLSPHPDHHPDRAWRWTPPNEVHDMDDSRQRPAWLLPAPVACNMGPLTLEQGPERIETGWWDDQHCQRDYWVAREPDGRKVWVFHEHKPRTGWFIHGIFG